MSTASDIAALKARVTKLEASLAAALKRVAALERELANPK